MGRRALVVGEPCRRGHPWNRAPDQKRCLTCYPPAEPRPLLPVLPRAVRPQRTPEERKAAERERRCRNQAKRREEAQRGGRPWNSGSRRTKAACDLLDAQGWRCGLTGLKLAPDTLHLDHKVPKSKGGSDGLENKHWVHPAANYAKGNMSIEEFRTWLLAAADALRNKIKLESLL